MPTAPQHNAYAILGKIRQYSAMKENLQKHHIVPQWFASHVRLPRDFYKDPQRIKYITQDEHSRINATYPEKMVFCAETIKKGTRYCETRVIPKEVVIFERSKKVR